MFCFKYPEIRYSTKYTNLVSFFTIFTLLFTSFLSFKDIQKHTKFYFIVLVIYIILAFYIVSIIVGTFEYFENFWLFVAISTLIDAFLFTIILYYKLKDMENQRKKQEYFIVSQARFTSLGNNVANMVHQWKNPIAQIGSQIALLEVSYHLDNKNYMKASQEIIPHIKTSILFMKDTMNDIYNFYKNPIEKELIIIEKDIDTLLRILDNKIKMYNIDIKRDIENCEFIGYKTSFLNALMIILENSIYQLEINKKENKRIIIVVKKINNNIIIEIEDNGGGINKKYIDKIFDLNFSTKKDLGSGVGLALAKELIEKRLNGNIKVENSSLGAKFTIIINS